MNKFVFRALPLCILPWLALPAFAQIPPDAGRVLEELRPTPALPAPKARPTTVEERPAIVPSNGRRIAVRGFRLTGASAFAQAELLALLADGAGREMTLAELDGLAARITRHYREAGYLVARAYLPAQEVKDGQVEIAVLEGRLGQVEVRNAVELASSALAPLVALVPGESLSLRALDASLLALADLPGIEVKSTLRPGAAVGTSDLLVEVARGTALNGSVDFDSFGNRYTGAHRLGGSVFWNNALGLGDQASLRVQTSDGGLRYGRVGYQLPLGSRATRVGAAWSEMRYKLGKDFAALDADGEASVASLYLLHPFVRGREASLYGQVAYDDKRLIDRVGATATRNEKALGNWTFGINGNLLDGLGGGGSNSFSAVYTQGHLDLDAIMTVVDRATAGSQGSFSKWSLSLQRLQRLSGDVGLYLSASRQWAGKNLDSSEKFSLGGAYGVRAYPQGEAGGDEGQLLSAELRWQLGDAWQVQGFYDDGRIAINRKPWTAAANDRHLAGYGLGAAYAGGGFTVRMFAAWKAATGIATSDIDRSPRIWVQAAKYF